MKTGNDTDTALMLRSSTVLIAEDSSDDVLLLRRAFKQLEWDGPIEVVSNGEEVIRYLTGSDRYQDRTRYPLPFLVLLDLKMPCKDGFEVLAWLRAQPQFKSLPVLVLTSSTHSKEIARAYELGATSYMVKPGAFEHMVETIDAVLKFWRLIHQPPASTKTGTERGSRS